MSYEELLGVAPGNTLVQVGSRAKGTLLQTDIYDFEERDSTGALVATHKVTDHTEIKAPFARTVSGESWWADGRRKT